MVVKAHDVVHQNLIDHFTECNSFIEDGLKEVFFVLLLLPVLLFV
jgi:hypothetical protein